MAKDPRKRQKQQERRAAKRKEKHHQLVRKKSATMAERLAEVAGHRILHSWVTADLWHEGIGYACISREMAGGQVAFANFLIDRYCLGVKNVILEIVPRSAYDSEVVREIGSRFTIEALSPPCVRKLVESAVAYAENLGLRPHPDYADAQLIFGTIDPAECTREFEFGQDGKPYFVAGPYDTPERCRHILNTLTAACGPDGFHYLLPLGPSEPGFPEMGLEGLDEEEDEDEDEGSWSSRQ